MFGFVCLVAERVAAGVALELLLLVRGTRAGRHWCWASDRQACTQRAAVRLAFSEIGDEERPDYGPRSSSATPATRAWPSLSNKLTTIATMKPSRNEGNSTSKDSR
ncbi:MAG: hypothetical protein ACI89X_002478 [Planctomycetota bacterium]|jgi:hypothetical protein